MQGLECERGREAGHGLQLKTSTKPDIKEGRVHGPLIQNLLDNHCINKWAHSFLKEELTLNDGIDKSIQVWINILQETASNLTIPRAPRGISIYIQCRF